MATWPRSRPLTLLDLKKTGSRGYLAVRKGHFAEMMVGAFDLLAAATKHPSEHGHTLDSPGFELMDWLSQLACGGICSGQRQTTETLDWPGLENLLSQEAAQPQIMPTSPHPRCPYVDLHKHNIRYTPAGCTRHRAAVDRTSTWIAYRDDN